MGALQNFNLEKITDYSVRHKLKNSEDNVNKTKSLQDVLDRAAACDHLATILDRSFAEVKKLFDRNDTGEYQLLYNHIMKGRNMVVEGSNTTSGSFANFSINRQCKEVRRMINNQINTICGTKRSKQQPVKVGVKQLATQVPDTKKRTKYQEVPDTKKRTKDQEEMEQVMAASESLVALQMNSVCIAHESMESDSNNPTPIKNNKSEIKVSTTVPNVPTKEPAGTPFNDGSNTTMQPEDIRRTDMNDRLSKTHYEDSAQKNTSEAGVHNEPEVNDQSGKETLEENVQEDFQMTFSSEDFIPSEKNADDQPRKKAKDDRFVENSSGPNTVGASGLQALQKKIDPVSTVSAIHQSEHNTESSEPELLITFKYNSKNSSNPDIFNMKRLWKLLQKNHRLFDMEPDEAWVQLVRQLNLLTKTIIFRHPKQFQTHEGYRRKMMHSILNLKPQYTRVTKNCYESLMQDDSDANKYREEPELFYGTTDMSLFVSNISLSCGTADEDIHEEYVCIRSGIFEKLFQKFYLKTVKKKNIDAGERRSKLANSLKRYTNLKYSISDEENKGRQDLRKKKVAVFDLFDENHFSFVVVVDFSQLFGLKKCILHYDSLHEYNAKKGNGKRKRLMTNMHNPAAVCKAIRYFYNDYCNMIQDQSKANEAVHDENSFPFYAVATTQQKGFWECCFQSVANRTGFLQRLYGLGVGYETNFLNGEGFDTKNTFKTVMEKSAANTVQQVQFRPFDKFDKSRNNHFNVRADIKLAARFFSLAQFWLENPDMASKHGSKENIRLLVPSKENVDMLKIDFIDTESGCQSDDGNKIGCDKDDSDMEYITSTDKNSTAAKDAVANKSKDNKDQKRVAENRKEVIMEDYLEFFDANDNDEKQAPPPRPLISHSMQELNSPGNDQQKHLQIKLWDGGDLRTVLRSQEELRKGKLAYKRLIQLHKYLQSLIKNRRARYSSTMNENEFSKIDRKMFLGKRVARVADFTTIRWGTVVSVDPPKEIDNYLDVTHGIRWDDGDVNGEVTVDNISWQQGHCYHYNAVQFESMECFSGMSKRDTVNYTDLDQEGKDWIKNTLLTRNDMKKWLTNEGQIKCLYGHLTNQRCSIRDTSIGSAGKLDELADMVQCTEVKEWENEEDDEKESETVKRLSLGSHNCFLSIEGVCALMYNGSDSTKSAYSTNYTEKKFDEKLKDVNIRRRVPDSNEVFLHPTMYPRRPEDLKAQYRLDGKFLYYCRKCAEEMNKDTVQILVACYKCMEYLAKYKKNNKQVKQVTLEVENNDDLKKRASQVQQESRKRRRETRSKNMDNQKKKKK